MSFLAWLLGIDEAGSVTAIGDWVLRAVTPLPWVVMALLALIALAIASLDLLSRTMAAPRTRLMLTTLRLAGFALVAVMLLQLEGECTVGRLVQPTVAVLTDSSASMAIADADGVSRSEAAAALADGPLAQALDGARVVPYRFSWNLTADAPTGAPSGGTRLVQAIGEVAAREGDLRAIVVLSDGNDTAGDRGQLVAPLLAARQLPVYPIVLGQAEGGALPRLRVEGGGAYVRLGDELRLSASLSAGAAAEQSVAVRLYEEGKEAAIAVRENVRLGADAVEIPFVLKPDTAGRKRYRIVAEGVQGATAQALLTVEREVDVIDEKIHVLYVDIPRDERKLLGHWLARDPVVDLATLTLMPKGGWHAQGRVLHKNVGEGLPNEESQLALYDVVILGDIPRAYFRDGADTSESKLQHLIDFVGRRGGGLITLGGRSVYAAGRYQDSIIAKILPFAIEVALDPQIPEPFLLTPTAAGLSHPAMQLEAEPQENRDAWLDLPTLDGANRVGAVRPGASLLATRETPEGPVPVIAVHNVGKGQVLSLAVDTTWRWEMQRGPDSVDHYRRFWGNAVRSIAPDPRIAPKRPQIIKYRSHPAVGQRLTMATRLIDDAYRPITGADVLITATSPTGRITEIHPRDGRQAPGLYEYDIALDEPGAWQVVASYDGKEAIERVIAGEDQSELDDPRARPEAMAELAAATGGRAIAPDAVADLATTIDLAPRLVRRPATIALWNLPLTLVLLLTVVCLDCWLRKRRGMV